MSKHKNPRLICPQCGDELVIEGSTFPNNPHFKSGCTYFDCGFCDHKWIINGNQLEKIGYKTRYILKKENES